MSINLNKNNYTNTNIEYSNKMYKQYKIKNIKKYRFRVFRQNYFVIFGSFSNDIELVCRLK